MKWVALALILVLGPAIAAWLRSNPRRAPVLWAMLTFLPFVIAPLNLDVAPFETPMWLGFVKGWQVTFLDAVAFGIVFGTRGRWPKLILVLPLLAYIFAASIAVLQAKFPSLAFSYVIQLLRILLVFLAATRVAAMKDGDRALLTGLILGLLVQSGYALWARMNGALQTGGSLGHQNLLGIISHMALLPAFAAFLAVQWPRRALVGVLAGLLIVALTASRATIVLAGAGLLLTLLLSLSIRFTGRKAAVGVVALVLVVASLPLAQATLERRFESQGTSLLQVDKERPAFERAAKAIMADYPMGVGPNHYVFVAITEGYSERAGVNWFVGNRAAHVHNVYLLAGAETGYLGLITLSFLMISGIFYAFSTAFRYRRRQEAQVLVGVAVALVAVAVHSFVEWVFVDVTTQYVFACSLGLVAGLRSRLATERKVPGVARRAVPRPFAGLEPTPGFSSS